MTKDIHYSKQSVKYLRRLAANVKTLIIAKINLLATNPDALANNIIRLQGEEDIYRLRVGDYRVIFTEDLEIIAIILIAPRGGAYD